MKIDDNIEKSEDGLERLIDAALMFEENHYLDAIRQKKLDEYDVLQLTESVTLWHSRMRKESLKLAKLSEHWIDDYATNCNSRFKDAYNLFVKVRSCISSSRKVFKKFCLKVMKNPTNESASNNVLHRSVLSSNIVSRDIFGLKSYSDNVQTLYNEMSQFFSTLVITLALCHRMLRDEAVTRSNPKRVYEIYRKCMEEVLSSARMVAKTFNIDVRKISEQDYLQRRQRAKSLNEYIQKNYHCLNKSEFLTLVAYEVACDGESNGLTEKEIILWGKDVEKVKAVRKAIACIESLAYGAKKLGGRLMLEFFRWCNVQKGHESLLYRYFIETYKGTIPPVGRTQITNEKRALEKHYTDDELAKSFENKLNILLKDAA